MSPAIRAEPVPIANFETAYATTVGVLDDDVLTIVYDQRDGNLTAAIGGGEYFGNVRLVMDPNAPFAFNVGASNWESVLGDTPTVQWGKDVTVSGFSLGNLLDPGLDEQFLLDNLTITYLGGCSPTNCATVLSPPLGDLIVTDRELSFPPPPVPPDPPRIVDVSLLYDSRTGELSLGGTEGVVYSTLTLEIKPAADGTMPPDDFLFDTDAVAIWDGEDTFQIRDETKLQGFITVPGLFGTFTMQTGDGIGRLLPRDEGVLFLNHVDPRFNIVGGIASEGGMSMQVIPEPSGIVLSLFGLAILMGYGRPMRRNVRRR